MIDNRHGHKCDDCGCLWHHDPEKFTAAKWRRYPDTMACAKAHVDFLYMLHHLCPRCGRPQYQKVEFHDEASAVRRRDMGEVKVADVMRSLSTSILPPRFRSAVQAIVDTVEPPRSDEVFAMMFFGKFTRRLKAREEDAEEAEDA